MRRALPILVFLAACGDPEIRRVSEDRGFDGTCVSCHDGLAGGQTHPAFKLRCIDCHGGNDQVADVPGNAFENELLYRDPQLIAASHVRLKDPALARFFLANGMDDDEDGFVDEDDEIAELGVQGEGVGQFIDSELNRDLDYTRWLNPGDLRVATVGCGSGNPQSGLGAGCHQDIVDVNRRSIMASNGAVVNGAYYGNQSWRETFQQARDVDGPAADPRQGAFGYVFDWDAIDACIVPLDGQPEGREQNQFDSLCLEAQAAFRDPFAAAGAEGNAGLPAFEATQGTIVGVAPAGRTASHAYGRYPWGGKPLGPETEPLARMAPVPSEELAPGIPDPVDNVLRGFRAYYPLNFPGSGNNFGFSFGESILPNIDRLVFNNPFGRGHSSGCTACHMAYARDGARRGTDPTTRHREFDPATQDVIDIGGVPRLVGVSVNRAERALTGREQQRFYSESHSLTTKITTDTCALCHTFVTRIDHSLRGMAEDEQRDAIARRAPLSFVTPAGTRVNILSSHVREEDGVLVVPEGQAVIDAAKARDADLALQGIPAGHGCAADVFSEDCNNNGELDSSLQLGEVTIDEDANGNGELDLIDRVPRDRSVDGRQFKYVYGGANGSTRLMDAHFEKGMHCIDCHFLQDAHGDGNLYSTNWEAIEIECEDCHGTLGQKATLVTSGQNGGNDLTRAVDRDGVPYFVRMGDGTVFQRSRVEDGLAWRVPQVDDVLDPSSPDHNPRAVPPMANAAHMPRPTPAGQFTSAGGMECYACHNAWTYNCMGCHYQMNLGDDVRTAVDAAGNPTQVPGENEVWFNNRLLGGKTDFQLLSLHRAPFVLGVNAAADGSRIAPFRSSMLAHISVNDANGNTILDNTTFTTFEPVGDRNVAMSGAAMNQTMPHTVRVKETRDCDSCHALVDRNGHILNDQILAQTVGVGAGRYPYTGDWILAAGASGLELFDVKAENQLKGSSGSNRFPGIIVSSEDRVASGVEPASGAAVGVALVRNFNPTPAARGGTAPPTFVDLALVALASGNLILADVTARGVPGATPSSTTIAVGGTLRDLSHLSPDISDPFVYLANGAAGLAIVELVSPTQATVEKIAVSGTVSAVEQVGDVIYVGTDEGEVVALDAGDPDAPQETDRKAVGGAVRSLVSVGFFLYVATDQGLAVLDIGVPQALREPDGDGSALVLPGRALSGVAVWGTRAFLAAGTDGVIEVDVSVPAAPVELGNLVPLDETVDARDVIVSVVPGQTWILVADAAGTGSLVLLKLDSTLNPRERCFPFSRDCASDMDFLDPTIMGRDPSFDPLGLGFDVDDPSGPPFQRLAAKNKVSRLARPAMWEQIGSLSGRRLRDSFMPGSGVIPAGTLQNMRSVRVCEADGADVDGNGRGPLGRADEEFFASGVCVPLVAP